MSTKIGLPAALSPHQPYLGRYQCQVCHCRRYEQLEERLRSAKVPRLAHAQLHETGETMFHRLTLRSVRGKGLANLKIGVLLPRVAS